MSGGVAAERLAVLVMEPRVRRAGPDGCSEARIEGSRLAPETAQALERLLDRARELGVLVAFVPYRQFEREFPGLPGDLGPGPLALQGGGPGWLEQIRRRHRVGYRDEGAVCLECGRRWPCDTALAVEEVVRLRGQVEALGNPRPTEVSLVAAPRSGDLLISGCRTLDPFASTELDALLRARGIDSLALTGHHTNWGLESAARSAYDRGYRVLLVSDCAQADTPEAQRHCEQLVFPRLGSVVTSAELLRSLDPTLVAPMAQAS